MPQRPTKLDATAAWWWRTRRKFQADLSRDERIRRAAIFVRDALQGRTIRYHRFQKSAVRIYLINTSFWFRVIVSVAIHLHLALIFGEPAQTPDHGELQDVLLGIETVILILYTIDLTMRAHQHGVRQLLRRKAAATQSVVTTLMWLDVIGSMAGWSAVRFSRPLRPVLLILDSQVLRRLVFVRSSRYCGSPCSRPAGHRCNPSRRRRRALFHIHPRDSVCSDGCSTIPGVCRFEWGAVWRRNACSG